MWGPGTKFLLERTKPLSSISASLHCRGFPLKIFAKKFCGVLVWGRATFGPQNCTVYLLLPTLLLLTETQVCPHHL